MDRRNFIASSAALAGLASASRASAATSFYRVEQIGEKWVLLDPQGKPTFLRGLNHFGDGTHMPLNLKQRYGTVAAWRKSVVDRHRDWGFNFVPPSIGPSEPTDEVKPPLRNDAGGIKWQVKITRTPEWPAEHYAELNYPFTAFLEYPKQYMAGKGLPDVFSQKFRDDVDRRCREFCAPLRDNPNLIGYHFTQNPPWHHVNAHFHQWIADNTLPGSPGLDRWVQLMRQIYGSIERWRRTYSIPVDSWDQIKELPTPLRGYISKKNELRDKIAFMERMCEEWYRVYTGAVRKYDPNHLILGDRNTSHLSPLPGYAVRIMGRYVDVISINVMGPSDIFYETMEQTTTHWDGPMHLADTGAGVLGDWPKAGFMARDIKEYEEIYRSFMTAGLEHPQLIGFGWCGYYETPTSRSGVVDSRNDEPLPGRLAAVKKWNEWMEREYPKRIAELRG